MSIEGWYYLHTNGSLIYKRDYDGVAADIRESDFALGLWPMDPTDRLGAWRIVTEALAGGADKTRAMALARLWQCDEDDAAAYAGRAGITLGKDGSAWCAKRLDFVNLQESPAGFGDSPVEAIAELLKSIGYRPSKMWGPTSLDLFKCSATPV